MPPFIPSSLEEKRQRKLVALAQDKPAALVQALRDESNEFLYEMTNVLEAHKLFSAAEQVYRVLLARGSDQESQAMYHEGLAFNLYRLQREGARAEEFLQQATATFPQNHRLANVRGTNLAWGLGRHAEALGEYERAVALAPDATAYQECLAWCLFWLGDIDRGRQHARIVLADRRPQSSGERLSALVCLFLFAAADERVPLLAEIAALIFKGTKVVDWDMSGLVARAISSGHPDAASLPMLVKVVSGQCAPLALQTWPTWQEARLAPDTALIRRIAEAVERISPEAVFEGARLAGERVLGSSYVLVPFDTIYADPEALVAALRIADDRAAPLAIRMLARLARDEHAALFVALLDATTLTLRLAGQSAIASGHEATP